MKTFDLVRWMGAVVVVALALMVPAGCDEGSGDDGELDGYFASHPYVSDPRDGNSRMTVSPGSAEINVVNGQAVFTAAGGLRPYSWDVSDPSVGSVSGSGEDSGVYTAKAVGENSVIVYDREGHAAIAKINGSATALSASADPSELTADGSYAVLTATGGRAPYVWSVSDPTKGALTDGDTGASVVYMRKFAGDNAVTVRDADGARASTTISQP